MNGMRKKKQKQKKKSNGWDDTRTQLSGREKNKYHHPNKGKQRPIRSAIRFKTQRRMLILYLGDI